ncbi:MOSC domain-containing protein [Tenacibaculum ovolyticum]|uniref:MOSC domain-containing protein n=2 Tax=Tenacibaculum ovolyticum TaxID=104270 RepID=UPI0007ECFDC4|nr:MOSC N-terminal beta barrel domain-containing protein [Tenacibaculum ovolyticum]WBX77981.1 MOSC domain-containing protein [Tenacibaculum ovolyticum]
MLLAITIDNKKMKIDSLYTYPIKSTKGILLNEVNVSEIGFENDRYFGIANSLNEIITARENPKLLKLKPEINAKELKVIYENKSVNFPLNSKFNDIKTLLFKKEVSVKVVDNEINDWLTKILKIESRLVKINLKNLREKNNTKISFSDSCPIHLITKESVEALNEKLAIPIEINRFRANIIVSGVKAFEERNWKKIIIGECEFKVVSDTVRCSLITINPENGDKDNKQEPLRTLAKEFKSNGKVSFGIYLVPTKIGLIKKSDSLIIKTEV